MLTLRNGTPTTITEVNFTFALSGGMRLKDQYGQVTWMSDAQGKREYPHDWDRWRKIAYHNGWCGMWYPTGNVALSNKRKDGGE